MSEAIVNAPIIVFAGAGASAHLGYPTAAEFLERLNKKVDALDDDFAQKLWHSALPARGNTKADFEDIYDWLEAVSESARVLRVRCTELSEEDPEQTQNCAEDLKELIEKEIVETYGTQHWGASSGNVSSCWGEFIEAIHPGNGQVVPIFTTNYDISFEYLSPELRDEYGIYVEDAFNRDDRECPWLRDRPTDFEPDEGERHAWVFRLHGCVAWQRGGRIKPAYLRVDANGSAGQEPSMRWPALIWPSKQKRPFEDPFWTEYRYFLRCLDRAAAVIFLGYGFADDHIKAAVAEAKQYNRNLGIIVISDEGDRKQFQLRVRPILEGHVHRFIPACFSPEGISELLKSCKKALQPFVSYG